MLRCLSDSSTRSLVNLWLLAVADRDELISQLLAENIVHGPKINRTNVRQGSGRRVASFASRVRQVGRWLRRDPSCRRRGHGFQPTGGPADPALRPPRGPPPPAEPGTGGGFARASHPTRVRSGEAQGPGEPSRSKGRHFNRGGDEGASSLPPVRRGERSCGAVLRSVWRASALFPGAGHRLHRRGRRPSPGTRRPRPLGSRRGRGSPRSKLLGGSASSPRSEGIAASSVPDLS